MIVKKVKYQPTDRPKPKAWQIGDLVDYIRRPHDVNPEEKIEHAGSRNFLAKTHAGQKGEMIGLASESAHSHMPVSHFIFSWREGEQPAAAQVDELVEVFLENMGLTGHQTVYGLHRNTENYHVHIAVNRMNPETMKVVRPYNGFDIRAAHKIVALIERKQGWASEQNARYAVNESGEPVRRTPQEIAPKPKGKAQDFETRTGGKSAQRTAQERGYAILKNAKSWPELHGKLAEAGLRFEQKGSGAIVFVGELAVKASSIDRAFSMKNLCKKLGGFVPGNYAPYPPEIEPEPVSSVNLEEWQTYRSECEVVRKTPPAPVVNPEIQAAKIRHEQERKILLRDLAGRGLKALNAARRRLALWQKKELRGLRLEKKGRSRKAIPRFETWLRARGLTRQADRWRYRKWLESRPEKPALPPPAARQGDPVGDPVAACLAHMKAIAGETAATSRLDAMIALRMRSTGHSREAVVEAIRQCASKAHGEKESRDWQRYAERAAAYAFGVAGDVDLAKSEALLDQWKKVELPEESRPEPPRMRMR